MMTDEETQRIFEASKHHPFGKKYMLIIFNRIFPIPYFLVFSTPIFAIIGYQLNKHVFNNSINPQLTGFSQNLAGYVDSSILLYHDIYAIGSTILFFSSIFFVSTGLFVKKKFIEDVDRIFRWSQEYDLPHQHKSFLYKLILVILAFSAMFFFIFWIVFPEPTSQGWRMAMVNNILFYAIFLNFFYFTIVFLLGGIILFLGEIKYVM